jgi:hypothetical protein
LPLQHPQFLRSITVDLAVAGDAGVGLDPDDPPPEVTLQHHRRDVRDGHVPVGRTVGLRVGAVHPRDAAALRDDVLRSLVGRVVVYHT